MNSTGSTKDSKRNQCATYNTSRRHHVTNPRFNTNERLHPPQGTDYGGTNTKISPSLLLSNSSLKMSAPDRTPVTAQHQNVDRHKRNHESAFTHPSANGKRAAPSTKASYGTGNHPKKTTAAQASHTSQPQSQSPSNQSSTHQNAYKRRARLIDTLTAQKKEDFDSDLESSDSSDRTDALPNDDSPIPSETNGNLQPANPSVRPPQSTERRPILQKNKKIKRTYAMSRISNTSRSQTETTATSNNDLESDNHPDLDAYTIPVTHHDPLDMSDDDTTSTVGIRSVHELRRAGANNRFSDEMDDLLSRIGRPSTTPSSMRRNALGELALNLKREHFERQFRDHSARDNIIKGISEESDIISGYSLVAALIIFLSSGTAPHLLHQLSHERVGKLLCRLLSISDDILAIAFERSANVSRQGRVMLGEVKKMLKSLPLWHGYEVNTVSPRTLGLHLLSILSRHSDPTDIAKIRLDLQHTISMTVEELIEEQENEVDRYLMVSILEAQSNISILDGQEIIKAVVAFLRSALETANNHNLPFTPLALKLAINVTNNESTASEFNDSSILATLSTSISEAFHQAQQDVENENPLDHRYDQLLLLLGILINILEHCSLARESIESKSLKQLSTIWADNVSFLNNADSVGKSKLSVAFGYLAIAVGYFYIITSNRLEMKYYDNWPGTLQLINTIHHFIGIYRKTNSKVDELELLVQDLRRLSSAEISVS